MKKFYHITKKSFSIVYNALKNGETQKLIKELSNKHPADISDLYEDLNVKHRMRFLELCPEIIDASVLMYLDSFYKTEVISQLGINHFKHSLEEWSNEDIIELIDLLDPRDQIQLINALDDTRKPALNILKKYDDDVVGRSMSLDFITIPATWTAGKALSHIKSHDKLTEDSSEVFVVNDSLNPIGIAPISSLISSDKDSPIKEIANFDIITINANSDQEKAYTLFNKYRISCMPVVENSGRMVGVLRAGDILKIVEEEVTEDYLNLGGIQDDEFTKPAIWSSLTRLRWLSVSFLNALLSPIIISLFQDTIQKTISLATLMPIAGSIGGNIGIQAVSVIIKAFSGKQLRERQYLKIIFKEALIGSINGFIIGTILGILSAICFGRNALGFILGLSMFFCATWAAFIGSLLPILFDKLGYDAALSSGPLVTTITDVSGFMIFLGIAKYILG